MEIIWISAVASLAPDWDPQDMHEILETHYGNNPAMKNKLLVESFGSDKTVKISDIMFLGGHCREGFFEIHGMEWV